MCVVLKLSIIIWRKKLSRRQIVAQKMFPIVFRIKMEKKIHNIIFTALFENLYLTRLPFIDITQDKNTLIRIEIVSKTYISVSFVSLPPQVIS